MIPQLEAKSVPDWLAKIEPIDFLGPFPLTDVLKDSLYYPSAGFDGDPVKYLGGYIHSFIYVDFSNSKEQLDFMLRNNSFRGYQLVIQRSVTEKELIPHGWKREMPLPQDGNPASSQSWIVAPYCELLIFERKSEFDDSHGPQRFSLIYLCADGAAAYQALYNSNNAVPKAIAIIQPGNFGGNWTNFEDPNQILARSVKNNPAGTPNMLLYGGEGDARPFAKPCWPDYAEHITTVAKTSGGVIGIWRKP